LKGALYTLESVIAILMILFIIIFLFQDSSTAPEFERINYKLEVYHGLKILENTDELRRDVMDDNTVSIENKLNPYIPDFLNYTIVIFNETTNITKKPSLVDKKDVISISYFLAGDVDNYGPRDVRAYLWGFD